MNFNNYKLLLLFIIFSKINFAQSISPVVISSGGGFTANGSAMLSSTVGEPMVETFSAGTVILTQGFQQPEDFGVSVKDLVHPAAGFSFGPNPTAGSMNLWFDDRSEANVSITLHDIEGKLIFANEIRKAAGSNYISMDLSEFAAGEYLVGVTISFPGNQKPSIFSQVITHSK